MYVTGDVFILIRIWRDSSLILGRISVYVYILSSFSANSATFSYQNRRRIMLYILIFKTDAYITYMHETIFISPNILINNIDEIFED